MVYKCPHCGSDNLSGRATVNIDFTPDTDGFDFDYQEIEDRISALIDIGGGVTFRCDDCNKYFSAKEVIKKK